MRDLEKPFERGGRHVETRRGDHEVVMSHERVQLRDRLDDLRPHALVPLLRERHLGQDPLGRKVIDKALPSLEPALMSTQPRHDPQATLADVTPQLGPDRSGSGGPNQMTRGPRRPGLVVRVRGQRPAFAGQSRKLAGVAKLADASLHPRFATEARLGAVAGQARRSTTAPDAVTATAVGTRTTPYLRASSGRRDTSTVNTVRPDARSSASSERQSVQSGCVNSTTISPAAAEAPSSARSTESMCRARTPRNRAAKR